MPKRRIDWEKVQKDYFAKVLTIQEVAIKHGMADSTLRLKAKEKKWPRDETGEINQRAQEKIAVYEVAELNKELNSNSAVSVSESAEENGSFESAIEAGATVKANVIVKHRKSLRLDMERAIRLENLFDGMVEQVTDLRDVATLSQAYKTLVESKAKLITLERQSFKIEDTDAEEGKSANVRVNVNFV